MECFGNALMFTDLNIDLIYFLLCFLNHSFISVDQIAREFLQKDFKYNLQYHAHLSKTRVNSTSF